MYQAGVKNITLIENKSVDWIYYDLVDTSLITSLVSTGRRVTIDNVQRPDFEIKAVTGQGRTGYEYMVKFFIFDIDSTPQINQLKNSKYGWLVLIEFYDGVTRLYPAPFFFKEDAELKAQQAMNFTCELSNRVKSLQRPLIYNASAIVGQVYRWDSELLTFDSEIYTWDYEL